MSVSILEAMIVASLTGGNVLKKYFERENFSIVQKSVSYDLVTSVDQESQAEIVSILNDRFPEISVVGEEGNSQLQKHSKAFYVDPLDGTLNFVHKFPFFAVSLGYWENDEPLVGVVYNPMNKDLFYAQKGSGAFLNGERIRVSAPTSLAGSLLVTGFPYKEEKLLRVVKDISSIMRLTDLRVLGSAALELCYVAAGIIDGYWEHALSPWDLAGGVLIAQEAGAVVSAPDGGKFDLFAGDVLAAAPGIHQKLVAAVNDSQG
ncbi:MAG: monophosphatase [Candidatus Atribacteria bacterium]|nr:monophosphatase [Candidatus Atribacteria bacterium]